MLIQSKIAERRFTKELQQYVAEFNNIKLLSSNNTGQAHFNYEDIVSQLYPTNPGNKKPNLDRFRKRLSIKLVENKASNKGVSPKAATKLIKPKKNQPILPTSLKQKIREDSIKEDISPII